MTRLMKLGVISVASAMMLTFSACGDDDEPNDGGMENDVGDNGDGVDAEIDSDGDDSDGDGGDADSVSELPGSFDWQHITDEGDPTSDCNEGDAECAADIIQLSYAIDDDMLHLALRFDGPFQELEVGSFEIFVFPPAISTGHSIRYLAGALSFWEAECASAQKHSGCHWSFDVELEGFASEWVDETLYICEIPLSTYGWEDIDEVLLGVAASPVLIQVTADFTDRYPDEFWITATSVEGLQSVSL